jgi:AAA+ superfamily predicted ATPase
MANQHLKYNATHLQQDLDWLSSVLDQRLQLFREQADYGAPIRLAPPTQKGPASIYQQFLQSFQFTAEERLILLLGMLPYIAPYLVEQALGRHGLEPRQIAELGGIKGAAHGGMIPTAETALFLLAGNNLQKRMECGLLFSPAHKFYHKNILKLGEVNAFEPDTSGVISMSKDVLHMITDATTYQPLFNANFPAKLITTGYDYKDIVLHPETETQLDEIKTWLKFKQQLMKEWAFGDKIHKGFKSLFYGPPGTGKSLAAALIGKQNKLPVYRVDLSMVISKYIGETEKNLSRIFDAASDKDWILFFDEADALFGKRSNIQSANDRFANQEVSYLLMRMEEYEGLAILATNFKNNIDKAFLRRFQSIVYFPFPDKAERYRLWEQSFSEKSVFAKEVDLKLLAENFSLTGAGIMNVVRYASIMALKKGNNIITKEYIMNGIKKELSKESSLSEHNQ